jgi:hypothetical protein
VRKPASIADACRTTSSSSAAYATAGSARGRPSRNGRGQGGEQSRARLRVATGQECHIVTKANEFVDQPSDDSFRPTVRLGRNALGERCYLGNTHLNWVSGTPPGHCS